MVKSHNTAKFEFFSFPFFPFNPNWMLPVERAAGILQLPEYYILSKYILFLLCVWACQTLLCRFAQWKCPNGVGPMLVRDIRPNMQLI
jgi:uncharacterized membrane protein